MPIDNNKLVTLLKALSKSEIKEFEKFIDSPFFTGGKKLPVNKIKALLKELKKYHPKFSSRNLTKEILYNKMYGGKYRDNTLRDLFSKMHELVYNYITIKQLTVGRFESDFALAVGLFNKKLAGEFEKQINKTLDNLDPDEPNYFLNKYMAIDYLNFYKGRIALYDPNLIQQMYFNFNRFYLLKALQLIMVILNEQRISGHVYEKPMYEELLRHIEENTNMYSDTPEILIYQNLVRMFTTDDEKYYFRLKELKEKYITKLNTVEQNNLYVCLGNYCLSRITGGYNTFHKERFEIDKEYLSSGLIDKKHFLKFPLFASASLNAIALGEYKWVTEFINSSVKRLAPEYRDFAENYIMAELFFKKKEFTKALESLSTINIELDFYKQKVKNLTLKIYVELQHFEEALYLIEASKKFLSKELDMTNEFKTETGRFLNYTRELVLLKIENKPDELQHFSRRMENEPNFREKIWILEKVQIYS